MKTLFAHDHRFFQTKDQILSKNSFDTKAWERYLEHTDELIIAARIFELSSGEDVSKYGVSNAQRVSFRHIPESHSWKNLLPGNKAQQTMNQEVAQVDAVIARLPSRVGTMAIRAAKKLSKPYVIEVVGDPVESYQHHVSKILKILANYTGKMMRRNIAESSHVLYVTKKDLQEKYPTVGFQRSASNVEIHEIPINMAMLRAERMDARVSNITKIGMIATLDTNYKGIDTAIEALDLLKQEATHLYILGPGNKEKWYQLAKEHQVADRITFCGTLPAGRAVLEWLDTIDIYIQPSRTEGVPRALIEAMARGCPAIGSVAGGIPELLSPEYTHEIANAQELADKLADLMHDPRKQALQSQHNIEIAANYTQPILQKQRAELFTSFFNTVHVKEGISND